MKHIPWLSLKNTLENDHEKHIYLNMISDKFYGSDKFNYSIQFKLNDFGMYHFFGITYEGIKLYHNIGQNFQDMDLDQTRSLKIIGVDEV